MGSMSERDFNIILVAGIITALAVVIFFHRMNKEVEREARSNAHKASVTQAQSALDA